MTCLFAWWNYISTFFCTPFGVDIRAADFESEPSRHFSTDRTNFVNFQNPEPLLSRRQLAAKLNQILPSCSRTTYFVVIFIINNVTVRFPSPEMILSEWVKSEINLAAAFARSEIVLYSSDPSCESVCCCAPRLRAFAGRSVDDLRAKLSWAELILYEGLPVVLSRAKSIWQDRKVC